MPVLESTRLLLTTPRELIAASALVVFVVIAVPAIVLALLRWRRSRQIDQMFAALPNAMRSRLLRQPSLLKQQAAFCRVSYLHCSFDAAQADDAKACLKHCAALRDALVKAVLSTGGTLDFQCAQSLGAYWNAPLRHTDHAAQACAAALRMNDLVTAANRFPMHPASESKQAAITIGVATGEAAVGVSSTYLVDGDAPRMATQLSQLCQQNGGSILTDKDTQTSAASSFAFLPLRESVRDASAPLLYALLGGAMRRGSPHFRALETFHARIFAAIDRSDWVSAKLLIAQARKLSGANSIHHDRLAAQIDEAANTPGAAPQIPKAA